MVGRGFSLSFRSIPPVRILVGGVFVYAALQKALHIPMFAFILHEILQSGTRVSSNGLLTLAILAVFLESFLGFALIVDYRSRFFIPVSFLTLACFSFILVALLLRAEPVRCGCLGVPVGGVGTRDELMVGLMRNIILFAILYISYKLLGSHDAPKIKTASSA